MTKQSKLSEAFQNYWCPAELGIFKCMISLAKTRRQTYICFCVEHYSTAKHITRALLLYSGNFN